MSTLTQAQALIDARITTVMAGDTVVKTNQDADQAFAATPQTKFTHFKVMWGAARQMELGAPANYRIDGVLSAIIYTVKGKGPADGNALLQKVLDGFRSQMVGDVTFYSAEILPRREVGTWEVIGVQIPFFTDKR